MTETSHYIEYYDTLGLRLAFVPHPMELDREDPDSVTLTVDFPSGHHPAWTEEEITDRLKQIAALAGNGCCGAGLYDLRVQKDSFSWGASSSQLDILMALSEFALTGIAYDALKALLKDMASNVKAMTANYVIPPLDTEQVKDHALFAVQAHRNTGTPADLHLVSMESSPEGRHTVVVGTTSGPEYTVDVETHGGYLLTARVRKTTYVQPQHDH